MQQTRLLVVGSAAGGGFPQWNCNCTNCQAVRQGDARYQPRTQSSIAWSRDGLQWLLLNASPDILTQLQRCAQLQPKTGKRDTGIAGVMLMDAQIDHVTGLVMLRENASALPVHATAEVFADLSDGLPLTKLLSHYCGIEQHLIEPDATGLAYQSITWSWLPDAHARVIPLHSKPPPYSPWRNNPRPGDNVGVTLINEVTGKRLFYAPGLGQLDEDVFACLQNADVVLVDGTFWTDDEMIAQGLGKKTAQQMGHLPQSGAGGMIEILSSLPASTRKILIHINNSNPILCEDSSERQILTDAGIEVAYDGMEIWF
ncbi:pyrroloquinoline quinone biosynthesis protein PqqB [Orrella daihaiensis]|uniref:Coenzyme PQQ synthesis protein B n=1 Tax=Orrella daihaiensis TaxID=2782176 RepID=A0ABY4AKU9_9BURK|nr:pyrroloquinoline quinone biosynthesis protein PqqB [Orrella daihaiensis]UOD50911.1 pyrroloquinoline quinone biosynthesis protein PqqB [Orrella daihaiensis]